ncbi:MAG: cellulase family glycosylhydrolase [Deinococcales bacterium]
MKLKFFLILLLSTFALGQDLDLKRGINVDGILQYPPFESLTEADLDFFATISEAEFDFIRLLVNPKFFISDEIKAYDSLKLALQTAQDHDLKVIIALYLEDDDLLNLLTKSHDQDVYQVFLGRLAAWLHQQKFTSIALELLDEAFDPSRDDCEASEFGVFWQNYLENLVKTIRRGYKNLPLVISGLCFSSPGALMGLEPLTDRQIYYSFHYFEPTLFTQQGTDLYWFWQALDSIPYPADMSLMDRLLELLNRFDASKQAEAERKLRSYANSNFSSEQIFADFQELSDWAASHQVKLFLGAFGVNQRVHPSARQLWLDDVSHAAETLAIPWAVASWQGDYQLWQDAWLWEASR